MKTHADRRSVGWQTHQGVLRLFRWEFCVVLLTVLLANASCSTRDSLQVQTFESESNVSDDAPKSGSEKSIGTGSTIQTETDATTQDSSASATATAALESKLLDWPQYRGPNRDSVQISNQLPEKWSDEPAEGILWQADLPGRGSSSPIVVGNLVFVTAFDGYGLSDTNKGKLGDLRHYLVCKDRESGETKWQRAITGSPLTQPLNETVLGHGFASSTPACDGKLVFASFGQTGLFAFDLHGELVWHHNLGAHFNFFGSSLPLTLYRDLLIVNSSIESKTIFAFEPSTGKAKWKVDNVQRCWSTPVFGVNESGQTEMIVCAENVIRGISPETGHELWSCEGIPNYIIATPVVHDGIVYCTGGLKQELIAVKLGGKGDVTKSHVIWRVANGANVGSPVLKGDLLFMPHENGMIQVFDRLTGKLIKKVRTPTKTRIYATSFLNQDKLYVSFQDEGVGIFSADENLELKGHNRILQDDGPWHSSLAANGDRFFIRSPTRLYCLADHQGVPTRIGYRKEDTQPDTIVPPPRIDFDPETGRLKAWCGYLNPQPDSVIALLLAPYKNVISEEQTSESKKLILEDYSGFERLRLRHNQLFFDFMKGDLQRGDLEKSLLELEAETNKYQASVRMKIKKLFSKEQMEQHLKDAEEFKKKQEEIRRAKRMEEEKAAGIK